MSFVFAASLLLHAQADTIEGDWYGQLEAGGIKLRQTLHLSKNKEGALSGTIDSVDQKALDLKLDNIVFENNVLRFEYKAGKGKYEGKRSGDGTCIEGTWHQGGGSFPLSFSRTPIAAPRRPQDPVKPYPYDEEDVTYENAAAKVKLAGTLTQPRNTGPHPVVLLITGSGAQDRDESLMGHRPFLVLADHLTRQGIAVLRVDDRGVGGSTGDPNAATSEDFAGDVLAGVSFLRSRKDIDPGRIGLVGHSEGGMIAPMVASRNTDVAFIVLLAGPGTTGEQILLRQVELIARASGAPEEAIARSLQSQREIYAIIRAEKDAAAVEKRIRELVAKDLAAASDVERQQAEVQIKRVVSPWFRFFVSYDPSPVLRQVKCPILAINGERDLQVPCEENLKAIDEALKSGGNQNYKTVALQGLNHLFQTCKTGLVEEYAQIEETFAPAALETVSKWILEVTARR